jgi:hypothetical protein
LLKDLLTHRILHFQNQVLALRATEAYKHNSDVFENHILRQSKTTLHDINLQRQMISRKYVRTSSTSTRQVSRFLDQPPFYTSVWDSYCLFIYNSQTYIYATLIVDPRLGRSEKFPERTTAAIDLCRAAAAREKHLVPQAASLCFAGLAFIDAYPRGFFPYLLRILMIELSWVERQLDRLVRRGRPCPGLYLDILLYLKENPTVPWQEAWLEIMSSSAIG